MPDVSVFDVQSLSRRRFLKGGAMAAGAFALAPYLSKLEAFAAPPVADNEGIGISRRRITLSTSGVVPNIIRTGDEIGVMLATLYQRLPDLEVTGPAVKMRAISSNGVKHLPVRWTPS